MGGKKEEGMLDLDAFVAEQLKLLQLEREAEIAEASAYISFVQWINKLEENIKAIQQILGSMCLKRV